MPAPWERWRLAHLLDQEKTRAERIPAAASPRALMRRAVKTKARARSVICLFQHGGPSQMDLFDPKPALSQHHGKPYPGSLEIHFDKQAGKLLSSPFRFRAHGQLGNGTERASAAHLPRSRMI